MRNNSNIFDLMDTFRQEFDLMGTFRQEVERDQCKERLRNLCHITDERDLDRAYQEIVRFAQREHRTPEAVLDALVVSLSSNQSVSQLFQEQNRTDYSNYYSNYHVHPSTGQTALEIELAHAPWLTRQESPRREYEIVYFQGHVNAETLLIEDSANERNFTVEHSASGSEQVASAKASVIRLQQRYPDWNKYKNLQLKLLQDYLNASKEKNEKAQKAIECLDYIKTIQGYDPLNDSETTLLDVLLIIWQAAHTKDAPPPELNMPIDEKYIAMRKESLIDKLYEAQMTYPNRPEKSSVACPRGIFTKIVSALNHAHQDVNVKNGLLSKEEATDSAVYWIKESLTQLSVKEQKQIWLMWEKEGENVASQFRANMKTFVSNELHRVYGDLLHPNITQEIINNFDYLPRPKLHDQWEKIFQTIDNEKSNVPYDADLLVYLQSQILVDNELTFEDESERLNTLYQHYLDCKTLVNQIVTYVSSSKAVEYVKSDILAPKNILTKDIGELERAWEAFKMFDMMARRFLNLSQSYKWNQKKQESINKIKLAIDEIDEHYQSCSQTTESIKAKVGMLRNDIEMLKEDTQSAKNKSRFSFSGLKQRQNDTQNDTLMKELDSILNIK